MTNRLAALRAPLLFALSAFTILNVALAETTATKVATLSNRHTVTLISSFDPIPDSLVPTNLPSPQRVYRTKSQVFGKTIYFLRVGFFANAADAETVKKRLAANYPGAFVTEVTPEELASATGVRPAVPEPLVRPIPLPPPESRPPEKPAPAVAETIYVLTLKTATKQAPQPTAPLPDALRDDRLYYRDISDNGKRTKTLNLGFYPSKAEAEKARQLLLGTYPQAIVRLATAQEREASINSMVTYVASKPAPSAIAAPATPASIPSADSKLEQQAADLMGKARAALTSGNNNAAIELLNQLLRLPPNKQSQEAQELIGLAYERNGDIAIAKREYELYLKVYPDGENAERVRQRLANLEFLAPKSGLKAAKKRDINVTTAYGSFSQYFYRGDSKLDVTDKVTPTLSEPTLTTTDLSALYTDFDFTGRMRAGDWDNRVVVRDVYKSDFLNNDSSYNRLYSGYAEVRNKVGDYGGRLGRQPGNSGGVAGRFDGLSLSYGLTPKWHISVVAGEPVEFTPINSDKLFWGTSVNFGTFAEHWNGSVYYFQQTVDSILDRQAVGTELRYFHPKGSVFLLTDYDISYSELNIAMLQAYWQPLTGTSFNLTADHRHAPLLSTSNAVINEVNTSIKSQLLTLTEEQLRAQALERTPTLNLFLLGVTQTLNPTWQLGANVQFFNLSGTPASGSLPAIPDSGDTLIYTLQGIGNSLFTNKHDISVLSLSYITNPSYDGTSVAISNRAVYRDRWTVDLSLRYYQQTNNLNVDQTRYTPQIRLGYRWRNSLTFEAEVGVEKTKEESATTATDTTSYFYTLGYRWDF